MPSFRPTGSAAKFLARVGTVSGFTMLSRATGFVRDVVLAWLIGAGPIADAFFIALRIPNHFRALFAEGAFNAAFVPTYAGTLERDGAEKALEFAARVLGALLAVQVVILISAELWARGLLVLITPGFEKDPVLGDLTVTLTRITFPYLLCVTLVTVYGAVLNAHHRYAAAAGAPILFNVAIVGGVLAAAPLAATWSNAPVHGAAIGVAIAGVAELILLVWALRPAGLSLVPARPVLDDGVKTFLKRLGPATVGSGAAQIAMFVDTILAAALPHGAVSAMYYADRLYQLPIGVIAIAIGTVLLPELSRRFAAGDDVGARRAQKRAVFWSVVLTAPFVVVFLAVPDLLVKLAFARGAFDEAAAMRAAATLRAYGVGLLAIVLLRSVVPGFHARGDTRTPMWVAFVGIGVNVALKFWLSDQYDVSGLALATSAGAWVNLIALVIIDRRRAAAGGA
ncbi:murein biosynthesis integral membrane protein MurJ [Pinisolibacter aquiterrae]|uniref:murein biosynthesis integral membrane protein MurJ n=1 Tax=Pinisolibacter aquiterrae TaxID=2815579 RepID=UPI001C3D8216|nr:murein biosynthesis integral membrane protein MurJ [Pinisolibacter aquiterrae]MBV5266749.1 murein biosynthesis integral membrane protein MurJ [Pinisolibacter aquiterrae]MCC8234938.1 murein biosynthesis integral membrane protein MurJ [Pinisolibacter aquiterrae]